MLLDVAKLREEVRINVLQLPVCETFDIPNVTCVYFLLNEHNTLMYVGKTNSLSARFTVHQFRKEMSSGKWTLRWKLADKVNFCNAEHEEAFYIALLRPKLNRAIRCRVWGV